MHGKSNLTRRGLLKRGAGLAAGALASPYMLTSGALGTPGQPSAGNRVTLGFIGVNWMGGHHLNILVNNPNFKIVGVCDVDKRHLEKARQKAGPDCEGYHDYRDLLARPDLDAVLISTPDHWHAKIVVDACAAGKDIYCEKPLSLTIGESRKMVEAVQRHGIVLQTGSMQRSYPCFRKACEWVRSGRIGKVLWSRAVIGGAQTTGFHTPQPIPQELDWDFWLGPAPWAEYTEKRCHITFRWLYDYSGGMMTDWGAHHNDIVQWGYGTDHTGPVKTEPIMAEFPTSGLWDTATRFEIKHTYADGRILYTCSEWESGGVHFQGTDGWIKVDRRGYWLSNPDIEKEPLGRGDVHLQQVQGTVYEGHHADWLECIKTRQRPITDVEIGARSADICHLSNIAIRSGKTIHWDPVKQEITNDPSLNRWVNKPYRAPWRL
ncbi:MAG: Gfo/Idh/MocA family oxidoreductase [Phycisphaerales bacterium]|nr:Gfo/Idh/MocA family oxidoreductase [Phycisphaerales bacterium]